MKKWFQDFLGLSKLIEQSQKQTELLQKIHEEAKRNSDLVEAYNKKYHI